MLGGGEDGVIAKTVQCDLRHSKEKNGGIEGEARVIQRYLTLKMVDKLSCSGVRRREQQ